MNPTYSLEGSRIRVSSSPPGSVCCRVKSDLVPMLIVKVLLCTDSSPQMQYYLGYPEKTRSCMIVNFSMQMVASSVYTEKHRRPR